MEPLETHVIKVTALLWLSLCPIVLICIHKDFPLKPCSEDS